MNKAFSCKIHLITQEENNKLKNVNKTLSHMFCNNTSKGNIEYMAVVSNKSSTILY